MCNAAFSAIQKESAKVGLIVNEGKTKYLLSTSRSVPTNQQQAELFADSFTFEADSDFICLGSAITSGNESNLEIKRRTILTNRCYYGLSTQMKSRVLSRKTNVTLYKTLIVLVLLYL